MKKDWYPFMINPADLKEFVENNPKLVRRRESIRHPGLFVIKYSRDVFFKNLWTPMLQECRGLVVDENYKSVITPFTKIFNRFENGADMPPDMLVTRIRKVNGFMAAATMVKDHGVVVSTTGSLDSDFVTLAEKWISMSVVKAPELYEEGQTFLFEIVDPSDPHIVPEKPGAYLIGRRGGGETLWGQYHSNPPYEEMLDEWAEKMGFLRPEWCIDLFENTVHEAKTCNHEGFVVYSDSRLPNGQYPETHCLKIKSPFYLVSKLFGRMGSEKLVRGLDNPQNLKQMIDEEYYPVIDYLQTIRDSFIMQSEQDKIATVRKFIEENLYV